MDLIWDYSAGYIIDTDTGECVERIFDNTVNNRGFEPISLKDMWLASMQRRQWRKPRKHAMFVKVQTFKREAEEFATHLQRIGVYEKVVGILDYLITNTHYASGLTTKNKLALAYMVYLLQNGVKPYYRFFRKWISQTSYRRLMKKATKILKVIQ